MIGNAKISIIVAIANHNAIGYKGNLLIYLPADLMWFKKNTTGHTIIMGRKTFESLPNGALPNRRNVVLTRKADFKPENCLVVHSIEDIQNHIRQDEEVFVIGGAEIYQQFLPFTDKLIITRIYKDFDADTFFPKLNFDEWQELKRIKNKADGKNPVDYDFIVLEKNKNK